MSRMILDGKTSGLRLYRRQTVRPRLPTAVFIHGAEHDHSVWALQSRYFAHHGFNVLAVDLPGHGRSAGPAAHRYRRAMADWLAALLDAAGVRARCVVGHSMGSLVALDFAARYPERASGSRWSPRPFR